MILALSKSSFPNKEHMERISKCEDLEKIWRNVFFDKTNPFIDLKNYFAECDKKLVLLQNAVNPVRALITKTTQFFIGGKIQVIGPENLQQKIDEIVQESKILEHLAVLSNDLQNFGCSTVLVFMKEKKIITKPKSYSVSFPVKNIDGEISKWVIGSTIIVEKNFGNAYYFDACEYAKVGEDVVYKRNLYKISNIKNLELKEKVSYASELGAEYAYLDTETATQKGIEIPVYEFKTSGITDEEYPMGITEQVISLLKSINVNLLKIDNEFRKNMAALLAMPANRVRVDVDANGNASIDKDKIGVIPLMEGDVMPKYITNDNPLIEECFQKIEKDLNLMATIAGVPLSFLGFEDGGLAESGAAKRLKLSEFLKKVEDYQEIFRRGIEFVVRTGLILKGQTVPADFSLKVKFREGIPTDRKDEAETLATEINSGIISQKSAIMEHFGKTESEADAEIAQMQKEGGQNFSGMTNSVF